MKAQRKRVVLAVDDDDMNLMILSKSIEEAGFTAKSFISSAMAWDYLVQNGEDVDIVLLDKMMPELDGLEMLKRIKRTKSLRHLPVILQTGDVGMNQMNEGLKNGAYYYLSKPFHPEILTSILHAAANECLLREELLEQMTVNHVRFMGMMREAEFVLKTHAEARLLAATIAQSATYPEFVAIGLMELLSNAIEHGNLEIGYDRKRKCLWSHNWVQELATRATSAEYGNRVVRVRLDRAPQGLHVTIIDEGKGFDWQDHVKASGENARLDESNGRGIAKALIMLDDLHFNAKGNEVRCTVAIPAHADFPVEESAAILAMRG